FDVWPGFSQFLIIGDLVRYSSHVKPNVLSEYLASVKCMANLTDSSPRIDVDERQTEWHPEQSGSNHQYHFSNQCYMAYGWKFRDEFAIRWYVRQSHPKPVDHRNKRLPSG